MANYPHVWNRNGYFYFRIVIPSKLINMFGCKELSCSLRTKNLYKAKLRSIKLEEFTQFIFMQLTNQGTELKPHELKELVKNYYREALARLEEQLEDSHAQSHVFALMRQEIERKIPDADKHKLEYFQPENLNERLDYLVPANYPFPKDDKGLRTGSLYKPFYFDGNVETIIKYVIEENDLKLAPYSPSYKALRKGIERAITELRSQHEQRLCFETEIKTRDVWFQEENSEDEDRTPPKATVQKELLSNVIETYLKECRASKETERSIERKEAAFNLWQIIIGDKPYDQINKTDVRNFKEGLSKYPANAKKKYPNKSNEELLKLDISSAGLLKVGTKNDYLSKMSALMTYINHNYDGAAENPFHGMKFADKENKKDKRHAFKDEHLEAFFSLPVFTGSLGTTQKARYRHGDVIVKDANYWTPLIGLYSGARMNEILQLHVSNIREEKGIWFFDINDEEDNQRTKTAGSRRRVPIHPVLIKLGFLDYVKEVEAKGHKRIFYDVGLSRDGTYSNNYSKRFSNLLDRLEIERDKLTFHSFRHTVKDRFLTETNVPEEIRKAILGHAEGDTHARYGNAAHPLDKLDAAIKELSFPNVERILKI